MEVVVTTGLLDLSRAKIQSNHHHQQTNIQFFTGRMHFLSPKQQCQSTHSLLVRIICFMSGGLRLMSYLFIYFFFLIRTSLWHYCNILFVALLNNFSYEDKRLAQHWTMHNRCIHWAVAFMTQNMYFCRKKLNTWHKLTCAEKQRNSIAHEHSLY